MVGTGANRMPLTKVHPILLGKQNNSEKSGGSSLLAQSRQMHSERMQSGGGGGGGQVMIFHFPKNIFLRTWKCNFKRCELPFWAKLYNSPAKITLKPTRFFGFV